MLILKSGNWTRTVAYKVLGCPDTLETDTNTMRQSEPSKICLRS